MKNLRKTLSKFKMLRVIYKMPRLLYAFIHNSFRKLTGKKAILDYLELNVTDHCNLNCKGCTHFSNLVEGEVFANLENYQKDMARMSQLFDNIRIIRFLGGEPLLNKELPKFIEIARKTFPYSDLIIVTNGILLKSMSHDLINVINSNNAKFDITFYKPLVNRIQEIEEFLIKQNIQYTLLTEHPIDIFGKFINLDGTSNPLISFINCPMKTCTFLKDGKISACCIPALIGYFNQYFNKSIPSGGLINIYDNQLTGFSLKKMLSTHMNVCKFCTKWEFFDWKQSITKKEKALEDWCVKRHRKWR